MTNPEKTDLVERLRELRAKATRGPWERLPGVSLTEGQRDGLAIVRQRKHHEIEFQHVALLRHENHGMDAALIVAAINALPALLDAVEALGWYASQETYADGPSVSDVAWAPEIPALSDRGKRARAALATLKGEG